MGSTIKCFFLQPIDQARQSLRRFTYGDRATCPGAGTWGHDASVVLETVSYQMGEGAEVMMGEGADNFPHEDPRWPKACSKCGYDFKPEDQWQHNLNRLFKTEAFPLWVTLESAPVGAMWYADWYPWKGSDGHCLVVKTPGGEWVVDGPNRWTRTGVPPNVTANPSILFNGPNGYHGWLRNGELVEC